MPVRAFALAALVVAAGCGKDAAKQPPAGSASAGSGSAAAPGSGSGSAAAQTVDCAALLNAGDIAAACELDAVTISVEPDEAEEDAGLACRIAVRINSRVAIRFVVDTRAMTPAAAKSKLDIDPEGATDVAIGDAAKWLERQGMAWMNHDLQVAKGKTWFAIKMPVSEKTGAPCSDDGLMTMGKTVASRLPAQ